MPFVYIFLWPSYSFTFELCTRAMHGNYVRELYAQVMHTSYARKFCAQVLHTSFAHEFFAHEFVTQAMRVSYAVRVIRTNYSHKFCARVFCASYTRQLCRVSHTHKLFTQVTRVSFAYKFCHAFNLRYVYRTDKFISPPLCPRTMQPFTTLSRTALPDSPHHTATHNTVIHFHVPRTLTRRAIRPCTVNKIHTRWHPFSRRSARLRG